MIKIRQMQIGDIPDVVRIEKVNFSRPWSDLGFLSALNKENTIYLTAELDGRIVGYAGMWIAADDGEITNVAVDKEFQNQKIGHLLLENMWKYGEKEGVTAYFLEVRSSNKPAITLYEHQGFRQAGLRKNFYEAPTEDGIVMIKR